MFAYVSRRAVALTAVQAIFALLAALVVASVPSASARAQTQPPAHYAPYAFLVGEWDVAPEGEPPGVVARFRWGPGQSYLWHSVALLDQRGEHPHFEGLFAWNGVSHTLDMLLVVDLAGGRVMERGTLSVQADGSVVRDISAHYSAGVPLPPHGEQVTGPDGAIVQFRQTFSASGPDRVLTSVMRRDGERWVPTFPGSDRLVMTRRKGSSA